jgi:uncharacterized protein (TIGR02284 family)
MNDDILQALRRLTRSARDAQRGFMLAAADARASSLRSVLERHAVQSATFAVELSNAVRTGGAKPARAGSVAGLVHRGWIRFRELVEGKSDALLIEECAAGERTLAKRYLETMDDPAFSRWSPEIRDAIESQYGVVQATEQELSQLR